MSLISHERIIWTLATIRFHSFVLSKNLARRHLTESQRAMIAAKIANLAVGSNQHVLRIKRDIATGEEISPPLKVAAGSLKVDRKTAQFARKAGDEPGSKKSFGQSMQRRGFVSFRNEVARGFRFVRVRVTVKGNDA